MKGLRGYRYVLLLFLVITLSSLGALVLPSIWQKEEKLLTTVIRPPREVSALAVKDGKIWAGGSEGLYWIDMNTCQAKKMSFPGYKISDIRSLLLDHEGILWIGSFNGLYTWDGNQLVKKEGLPDQRVNCIFKDDANNIWVGTWQGAAVYQNGVWKVYGEKEGLISDMVNTIFQDSRGWMWFGSYAVRKGGVSCWDGQNWHIFDFPQFLSNSNVCDILEDHQGRVWVATGFVNKGGASCFVVRDGKPVFSHFLTVEDGLAGEKVRSIFIDSKKRLWFCSEFDGVAIWDGREFRIISRKNGLSGNEVKDMFEDREGNFWLATENGITRIEKGGI
ncbi:Two component regulator propeller [Thermosyntropha lipolytica DSM 11003]|uniref:Two component regulator propeller n=1 Tax=Thermosyntropha lipolytica DSM 11003 TaxID=1123382 RepID=A0A1M5K374_9FIRM|nr:two-component regulator propeller domain-containing protein [Thermosyntropha lipolytica]SHG47195.1 Two component regulator propeller [Thermosyntropha lipolytica DSM 11003]